MASASGLSTGMGPGAAPKMEPKLTGASNFELWSMRLGICAAHPAWKCADAIRDPLLFQRTLATAKEVLAATPPRDSRSAPSADRASARATVDDLVEQNRNLGVLVSLLLLCLM